MCIILVGYYVFSCNSQIVMCLLNLIYLMRIRFSVAVDSTSVSTEEVSTYRTVSGRSDCVEW